VMVQQVMLCGSLPSLLPHTTEPENFSSQKEIKQTNRFANFCCTIFAHFSHWQQPIIQFRKINWSSHISCKTHLCKCIACVFLVKPIHENVQFLYSLKNPSMKMYSLSYTLQNPYMKMYSSHIPCNSHTWKRKKQSHLWSSVYWGDVAPRVHSGFKDSKEFSRNPGRLRRKTPTTTDKLKENPLQPR
jgi:hypothetical protein